MNIFEEFTREIEGAIQEMNSVDELLDYLIKSETLKWNRIRDYLIMKRYKKFLDGELNYKNTQDFIVNQSIQFNCSGETIKNIIYGKDKIIRTLC